MPAESETRSDVTLPGVQANKAVVYDIVNGTDQEIVVTPSAEGAVLKGMLIKDYPVFVRIAL